MIRFSGIPAVLISVLVIGVGVVALGVIYWLWQPRTSDLELMVVEGDISRGAYLARMSGCITCHTDFESDGAALAGGKEIVTPFGKFRAPNLTTDKEHGIGSWTIQQFSAAVREGISPDGKPYYPVFPYSFYSQFSDQEIADLWSAFQTVSAVSEPDPKQDIDFPFNIRQGLNLWRALFFNPFRYDSNTSEEDKYERGKFIVEVAAHCGACHTPRNILGVLKTDKALSGGVDGEGNIVPSITSEQLKAKEWMEDDLAYALQTSIKADGDVFGGSMSEVVEHGTAYMNWEDLTSVAHFLLNRGGSD